MNDYSRYVAFESTSYDYELFQDPNVKSAIKTRLSIVNDEQYNLVLANGISGLAFFILADSRISVNDEPYYYNEPIFHVLTGDGQENSALIRSIKIENSGLTGTFCFRIA